MKAQQGANVIIKSEDIGNKIEPQSFYLDNVIYMNKYDDIINLPHWEPRGRKRMSMESRAAQFAPFAALKEGEKTEEQ